MRKLLLLCIGLYALVSGVGADEVSIVLPSARTAAIGGLHAAYSDDLSSLFNNPAGFVSADSQLSIAEITVGMSGPIFDIANIAIQAVNSDDLTSVLGSDTVRSLVRNLYAAADVAGPIYFGYVGRGLGFGFFNTTDITFETSGPLSIEAIAGEQIVLSGGYALRLPLQSSVHTVDIGILLKGVLRGEVTIGKSLLEIPALVSGLGIDTVTSQPFRFTAALGIDAGVRYAVSDVFALGIVGRNLYTPTFIRDYTSLDTFLDGSENPDQTYGTLPADLSIGILISPHLGRFGRFISDLKIFIDYNDVLDFITHNATSRNPVLHAGLGVQLTLLNALDLRAGFSDGLLNAGLGIDLNVFRMNVAMFGTELSTEPGLRPVYNAMIGFEFRL